MMPEFEIKSIQKEWDEDYGGGIVQQMQETRYIIIEKGTEKTLDDA